MRRKVAALLAAPLLLSAGCGGTDEDTGSPSELDAVTVGVVPTVDVAPLYLGRDQGFFRDQGIELTLQPERSGARVVPGVIDGNFQFGFSDVTTLLLAAQEGLPLRLVAGGSASTGRQGADFGAVVADPDSGISDAADLEDKRVGVNSRNDIGTTTINESVRAAGGDPSGIEYVPVPFADMPAAVEAGEVDAAWVVEPYLTLATAGGAAVVASPFADTAADLTVGAYATTEKFAAEDADLVERFTTAVEQSLAYASEHEDEVRAVVSTYTNPGQAATAESVVDRAVTDTMTLPAWSTEINRASVERLQDLAVDDGLLDGKPDLDHLLP